MANKKRSSATLINNIKMAVTQIKHDTSTDTPQLYSVSKALTKHNLPGTLAHALSDLGLLEYKRSTGQKGLGKSYDAKWLDNRVVDEALAREILHRHRKLETKRKAGYSTTKTKTNKVPAQQTTKTQPQAKEGSKRSYPEHRKPAVVKVPIEGAMFGYKQLTWIKRLVRDLPTTVVIDGYLHIENVKIITFEVKGSGEKSSVVVTFYMMCGADHITPDLSTKISQLTLDNRVLAFKEHGGDTQVSILKMQTVAVKDPFNLNL